MTDRSAEPRDRSALLLMTSGVVLLAFYYFVRADAIGVSGAGRPWVPMTGWALPWWGHYGASAILLAGIPTLVARFSGGYRLRDLGLGLGNGRLGLKFMAAGIPLAIVAGAIGAASPAMRAVYPLYPDLAQQNFAAYALVQFLYYGAWEVLFRGVLLFGLRRRVGDGPANALQTVLTVTVHFGRAIDETAAALAAGPVFGWVSLKTGSIWYVAVVHWLVGTSMDWFITH